MLRATSAPVGQRSGGLLPRIHSNPNIASQPPIPYEKLWNVDLDAGVASVQGHRPYHEDEYQIVPNMHELGRSQDTPVEVGATPPEEQESHFFAVFDGHAGGRCSKAISMSMAQNIAKDPAFYTKLSLAIRRGFHRTNEQWMKVADRQRLHDGSTAVAVVLRANNLVLGNVGDSRAILLQNGKAVQLTNDHKPGKPEEQRRIISLGGSVVSCMGIPRVNGVLAVSRAFGNRMLKDVIRADPEITELELHIGDDFLILGSDGLYDVLTNQEICGICSELHMSSAQQIADHLVGTALQRGSMDNITAVVVDLRRYILRVTDQICRAQGLPTPEGQQRKTYPPLPVARPVQNEGAVVSKPARITNGMLLASPMTANTLDNRPSTTMHSHTERKLQTITQLPPPTDSVKDAKEAKENRDFRRSIVISPGIGDLLPMDEPSVILASTGRNRPFTLRSMLPNPSLSRRPKTSLRRAKLNSVEGTQLNIRVRGSSTSGRGMLLKSKTAPPRTLDIEEAFSTFDPGMQLV